MTSGWLAGDIVWKGPFLDLWGFLPTSHIILASKFASQPLPSIYAPLTIKT